MKTKMCIKLLALLAAFLLPVNAGAQCAGIFRHGVENMQNKNYKKAIENFEAAKVCDPNLAKECNAKIEECRRKLAAPSKPVAVTSVSRLAINKEMVKFGYETMTASEVKVESEPAEWTASSDAEWCKVHVLDNKRFSIECLKNTLTRERRAVVTVSNERMKKSITVVQTGLEEIINIPIRELVFSSKGEMKALDVKCNTDWEVAKIPDWVKVIAKDSEKLVLKVEKNKKYRQGSLVVRTIGGEIATTILVQEKRKLKDLLK